MIKLPDKMHYSWHEYMQPLFDDVRFRDILSILVHNNKCPVNNEDVFRIFRMSLQDIRVVIVGQDVYPNPKYANGIAFAIPKGIETISHSLHIIETELQNNYPDAILDPTLTTWLKQGVFLFNRSLTCQIGNPNSHYGKWAWFTEEVVKIINRERNGLHFALWGNSAKEVLPLIDVNKHYIYTASHPMSESYGKNTVTNGFYQTKHFIKINKNIRRQYGKEFEIKW